MDLILVLLLPRALAAVAGSAGFVLSKLIWIVLVVPARGAGASHRLGPSRPDAPTTPSAARPRWVRSRTHPRFGGLALSICTVERRAGSPSHTGGSVEYSRTADPRPYGRSRVFFSRLLAGGLTSFAWASSLQAGSSRRLNGPRALRSFVADVPCRWAAGGSTTDLGLHATLRPKVLGGSRSRTRPRSSLSLSYDDMLALPTGRTDIDVFTLRERGGTVKDVHWAGVRFQATCSRLAEPSPESARRFASSPWSSPYNDLADVAAKRLS